MKSRDITNSHQLIVHFHALIPGNRNSHFIAIIPIMHITIEWKGVHNSLLSLQKCISSIPDNVMGVL